MQRRSFVKAFAGLGLVGPAALALPKSAQACLLQPELDGGSGAQAEPEPDAQAEPEPDAQAEPEPEQAGCSASVVAGSAVTTLVIGAVLNLLINGRRALERR